MKILVVADWHGEIYAQAIYNGFLNLGVETHKFSWKEYFHNYQFSKDTHTLSDKVKSFYYKAQNKFLVGPVIWKINRDLVEKSKEIKPDLIFIYRGTHIYPGTLKAIKDSVNCKIFGYNNDDPFSKKYKDYVWKHYKNSIGYYDHIFAYREKNIEDYKKSGFCRVSILRSYYRKEQNYFIEKQDNKYKCDVVFIGHFENDGRDESIKYLIENHIDIKLFGPEWHRSKYYDLFKKYMRGDIKPLNGKEYNLAINSAKIALVFLSKKNNDTYTRRCFEIPATKTMMMAEYTDDLNSMFEEGKEAEYFRNKDELLEKVKFYLASEEKLKEIGENGYKRVMNDGHEVIDRCKEVLKVYEESK